MWSRLQLILPKFFKDLEIYPSLLHGDLWGGNASETKTHPGMSELFILIKCEVNCLLF